MAQTATVQIQMPEMGESVTEGIVLEWHVAEGDFVNEGDTVVEVSTDKVDAEVPAPTDGVITKLIASVDDEVPVGAPSGGDGAGRWRGFRRGFRRLGRGSCRGEERRLRAGKAASRRPRLDATRGWSRRNGRRDQGQRRFPRRPGDSGGSSRGG